MTTCHNAFKCVAQDTSSSIVAQRRQKVGHPDSLTSLFSVHRANTPEKSHDLIKVTVNLSTSLAPKFGFPDLQPKLSERTAKQ